MPTTALRHVPVLMTGTWNASTGTEPISDEDLQAIVAAAESGLLDPAILKKGHTDPRFANYLEDGEPAYGQVKNPVIEDGVLYVDYDPIDTELAESLEVSYPRCSVELARNVELRDTEGNLTAQFDVALTAVALLGATPPAVKGLSVHASALSEDQIGYRTTVSMSQFSAVKRFAFPGGNTARSLQEKLSALVRATHGGDYTWVFLEDFNDDTVIFGVEGDADLVYYSQSYTATANGGLNLGGTPTQVIKETSWVKEPPRDTNTNVPTLEPAMAHAMSEAAKDKPETARSESAPEGEETMPTVDKDTAAELRRKYDLPNNASFEDILGAVLEDETARDAVETPKNTPPGSDETPNEEVAEQQAEETEQRLKPYLAQAPADTETAPAVDVNALREQLGGQFVSTSAFAQFQQEHEQVKAALAARDAADTKKRRDDLVRGWFSTGRVGPDDAQRVRESLDAPGAEDVVRGIIDARPQLFSREIGHGNLSSEFMAADTDATLSEKQYETDDAVFGLTK